MLTQIYEVATPEEAVAISAIGVDHIGILIGDGRFPRELNLHGAQTVAQAARRPSKVSALFLSDDLELITKLARALKPDIVHLGAAANGVRPTDVERLRRALPGILMMRSIAVTGEESIAEAKAYDGIADFLLLDSYRAGDAQIGALGVTHDWRVSRRIVIEARTPVILAGGLGPDNVAQAIRAVAPAGVDSKTRTDVEGCHAKDIEKVRRFHEAAKSAA
jgi:phosphoribosylanthranilate isomerase